MPSGSPPEHVQAFLRAPRPAIIGSLLANGSPRRAADGKPGKPPGCPESARWPEAP
jgi:hypothetical protein